MVNSEHLNDFKEFIAKHKKIQESHKKYYIIWVELFLKYLEQNSSAEKNIPKAETLTNFTKHLYEINKYQEWQINQAIDAINLFFSLSKDNSEFSLEFVIGQIRNTIKLKHYSDKTEKNYIY